ncbi:hypothetical protein R6Q59_006703 [Mikania micrantha]
MCEQGALQTINYQKNSYSNPSGSTCACRFEQKVGEIGSCPLFFVPQCGSMGLLDLVKLDTNSYVESTSRPLMDGEEDVVTSHAKNMFTSGDYRGILPDDGISHCELPPLNLDAKAIADLVQLKCKKKRARE